MFLTISLIVIAVCIFGIVGILLVGRKLAKDDRERNHPPGEFKY